MQNMHKTSVKWQLAYSCFKMTSTNEIGFSGHGDHSNNYTTKQSIRNKFSN